MAESATLLMLIENICIYFIESEMYITGMKQTSCHNKYTFCKSLTI